MEQIEKLKELLLEEMSRVDRELGDAKGEAQHNKFFYKQGIITALNYIEYMERDAGKHKRTIVRAYRKEQ